MKAVRLTTAFAVVFGVVLPLPAARDLIPPSWAAEKDAPDNGALRQRVEDLAKSASDRFGEIVGGKEEQAKGSADAVQSGGATVGLVERIHGWTTRSSADYQELMRGLAQAPQYNPVAEATARLAARRAEQGASGAPGPEAQSFIETVIGWIHRAGVQYQTVVRGLLSEPGETVVAAKNPETDAKQAEGARRLAEILKAAEAKKVEEARVATAKQAEAQKAAGARKSDEAQVAAAKQAEDTRRAEEARRVAEAQKAAEAKKAEEARVAAAKQAEDARRAEEARRVAEAQKAAAEAKKAEEVRVAAAKQAEDARRAEEARRIAEAKRAEEARVAVAKQAEDTRRAEEARRAVEVEKAAEAKKAEEARVAAATQAETVRRTEETRRAAEAQKVAEARKVQEQRRIAAAGKPAETKASETAQVTTTPSRKRTAAQRQAERKERIARKSGGSRKVAGMAIRKRARQTASAGTGKGGRRKAVHDTCRVAGNRTSVPGWYIVRRGDTLWKIAARHYGKGGRFPVIYQANKRRIADPDLIFRCQRIYLPKFRRRT
jgi:hypothetical protein